MTVADGATGTWRPGSLRADEQWRATSRRPFHVAYCLGTRPEVIRSARLLQLLARDSDVVLTIVSSGQHYDANMFGDFLVELDVPPTTQDLGVTAEDPAQQTAEIVKRAGSAFASIQPEVVCVFGDTNSSLGFALAAVKLNIPLVHVEAGCRSYDMTMPEEVNRRLIDHCAGLLLAVSELGAGNVRSEGVLGLAEVVGDPLFDVYSRIRTDERGGPRGAAGLLTLHRPSNVDEVDRLGEILGRVGEASRRTGIEWVFPVHPRTRRSLPRNIPASIRVVDPLPYSSLMALLRSANVCVTDSGGLQKEALWARVPCVTIRPSTEWLETVRQGANVLSPLGSDIAGTIVESVGPDRTPDFSNPYGDGRASERIREAIKRWISGRGVSRLPEMAPARDLVGDG